MDKERQKYYYKNIGIALQWLLLQISETKHMIRCKINQGPYYVQIEI